MTNKLLTTVRPITFPDQVSPQGWELVNLQGNGSNALELHFPLNLAARPSDELPQLPTALMCTISSA